MNKYGQMIKHKLIDFNITQKELAQKMNITTNGLNSLLNRDNILLDRMEAIAAALDCDLIIELKPKNQ